MGLEGMGLEGVSIAGSLHAVANSAGSEYITLFFMVEISYRLGNMLSTKEMLIKNYATLSTVITITVCIRKREIRMPKATLNITVDKDVLQKFKHWCKSNDTKISTKVNTLMRRWLDDNCK